MALSHLGDEQRSHMQPDSISYFQNGARLFAAHIPDSMCPVQAASCSVPVLVLGPKDHWMAAERGTAIVLAQRNERKARILGGFQGGHSLLSPINLTPF